MPNPQTLPRPARTEIHQQCRLGSETVLLCRTEVRKGLARRKRNLLRFARIVQETVEVLSPEEPGPQFEGSSRFGAFWLRGALRGV